MKRIRWTPAQKQEVAERSFEIRQASNIQSDLACVRDAMKEIIPEDKWRDLTRMHEVAAWVNPIWTELNKGLRVPKPHQTTAPTPAVTAFPAAIQPVVNPVCEPVAQQPKTMADFATEVIAKELVSRLLKEALMDGSVLRAFVQDEIHSALEQRLPEILKPREWAPEAKAIPEVELKAKPKVCVIGLMGQQRHMLESEYKDQIHFFFLEGNEGGSRIRNQAATMDMTIKTHWVKGTLPQMNGVPNFQHARGMDSIRNLLRGKFQANPLKH